MIDISRNHLVYVNEDGEIEDNICEAIEIVGKTANFVSGDTKLAVKIAVGETPQVFLVERETLAPNNLYGFLLKKGVHITADKNTLSEVSDYLFDCDKEVPVTYNHDRLGFIDLEEGIAFLHHKPVGKMLGSRAFSEYIRPKEVASNGTLEGWLTVVEEEIQGHTPMELALATGFSSVIAHLLRRENVYAEIPVVGFIGDSSTGKTTAAKVCASPYGPITEGVGLVKDVNATKNAFFKILERQAGLPQILDETTGRRDWNLSDTIYELVKGKSKAVCNTSSELKEQTSFSGTVIITGEKSIFDGGKVQMGMLARVSEFQNVPWTKDADHSRRICEKFNANHGTAVVPFVTYVLDLYEKQPTALKAMFKDEVDNLHDLLPNLSGVEERILNIFSTILISAVIANEALGLSLNVAEIRKLLVNNHLGKRPVQSQARQLYELVVAKINLYHQHFPGKSELSMKKAPTAKIMGTKVLEDGEMVVWVTCNVFEWFVKNEFPNYTPLLKELHKEGLIKRDAHRHYKFKRTINYGKVPCYGIVMEDWLGRDALLKAESQKKRIIKRAKNLLEDDEDEKVAKEVEANATNVQNLPQQFEIKTVEELKSA